MRYFLLFPGLPIFSFSLLLLGGIAFPIEFEVLGRRIYELESLTVSGGKSLANIVEIFAAMFLGFVACLMLKTNRPKSLFVNKWRVVWLSYLVVTVVYFLMPALPE